jgi:hypothetical protein
VACFALFCALGVLIPTLRRTQQGIIFMFR